MSINAAAVVDDALALMQEAEARGVAALRFEDALLAAASAQPTS